MPRCTIALSAGCGAFALLLSLSNFTWLVGTMLLAIGALIVLVKFYHFVVNPLWHYCLRLPTSFEEFRGDWAVVTGASRGLGQGYALGLARRGLNVVLMARSRASLEQVAASCEALGVRTHVFVADFSEEPCILYPKVAKELEKLDGSISVLVNNVGGMPSPSNRVPMPCYCEEIDHATYESFFKLNVTPTTCMTHLLLASMVQQGKGYILNVSSVNGLQACPYLSPYSAAKAYISSYSASLRNELRGRASGVHVDAVCPGPVATAGIGRAGLASDGIPDPGIFAERSLSLAKTAFAEVPWPGHWWSMQSLGPSQCLPKEVTESRLYRAMDFSKLLGPPKHQLQ
eukprot:gnl/TRDRNA2_/TRDRNA2_179921_c0_seq1.p1 gnl/TRDRNA2_/TRDRNA2_179921_c0~~gnl/TRDRNA2_/TRDRNA2_179921_c0_seq1.p1  ORF type:complete len:344 (-),score=37.91 gnl/TRDRNA2_/TRDRNA2_179921_c0_seq1:86-1117(-)